MTPRQMDSSYTKLFHTSYKTIKDGNKRLHNRVKLQRHNLEQKAKKAGHKLQVLTPIR